MKTVEIKNFELYTTGVISIAWTEKGEDIFGEEMIYMEEEN